MSVAAGPNIIEKGLVLCLDAGNKKSYSGSGNVLKDLSGNENNGSLINGVGFNSANKGSLVFDGTNDYISIPSETLKSGPEITFSVWNFNRIIKSSSIIGFLDINNTRLFQIHLPWGDGTIYFDAGDGVSLGFNRINKFAGSSILQKWIFWTFTKNSNTGIMRIYQNNELWHSGSGQTRPIGVATGVGCIGNYSPTSSLAQDGTISNCCIYNRELSPTEILQNYNATKGRFRLT